MGDEAARTGTGTSPASPELAHVANHALRGLDRTEVVYELAREPNRGAKATTASLPLGQVPAIVSSLLVHLGLGRALTRTIGPARLRRGCQRQTMKLDQPSLVQTGPNIPAGQHECDR